jgi:hypothetical protein
MMRDPDERKHNTVSIRKVRSRGAVLNATVVQQAGWRLCTAQVIASPVVVSMLCLRRCDVLPLFRDMQGQPCWCDSAAGSGDAAYLR